MKKLLYSIFLCGCLSSLIWGGYRLYATIQFGTHCEKFLRHSAEAHTVEEAKTQLQFAINYCDRHNLTSGYTSLIFRTDDDNIGMWYDRLKKAQTMLYSLPANTTSSEHHAVLIKLRKALLTNNTTSTVTVQYPDGICLYPHNVAYMVWGIISLFVVLLSKIAIDSHH